MTAPPRQIAELRARAIEQLEAIWHELAMASLHRAVYREVRDEITKRHPLADGTFINSYSGLYARGQMMLVRRMADDDADSGSLWQLINRIRRNPAIASRSTLVAELEEIGSADTARSAANDLGGRYGGTDTPSDEHLEEMQTLLRDKVERVLVFVDKNLAHRDPRGAPLPVVTYKEVEEAVDHVMTVFNDVSSMLRYTRTDFSEVTIGVDWHECLRPGLFPFSPEIYMYDERSFS